MKSPASVVADSAAGERRVMQLHPQDNVVVLTRTVAAGERVCVGGVTVMIERALALGHKLAACDIPAGAPILKYGVSIGSAAVPIPAGAHVHTHNLRSNYLPTYLHATQQRYFEEHP